MLQFHRKKLYTRKKNFFFDGHHLLFCNVPWLLKIMSRSGYFKDLGNFGQQIINQVASDIRSNAENLVYSLSQDQQQAQQNHSRQSSRAGNIPEGISRNNSNSGASTPSERGTSGGGPDSRRRSSSTSSSQATTPEEVAGDWLNNVSGTIPWSFLPNNLLY